jgi:hypothetical protein
MSAVLQSETRGVGTLKAGGEVQRFGAIAAYELFCYLGDHDRIVV